MMQPIRLETKGGDLLEWINFPGEGNEPDAILMDDRVFIRRPMLQTQPPKKNSPETYFEAHTHRFHEEKKAIVFDKVTETIPIRITEVPK